MRKRSYREKRPRTLGVMQVQPTRHTAPSYVRALVAAGLTDANTQVDTAWGIWTAVCGDKVVIRMSMELERQSNVFLPSVASAFQNGTRVLQAMNSKQIDALKQRIGIRKEATK
jgi:hypothetical protein